MDIEQRNIDSIRPYEANPRRNDKAVDAVARSIREFGFRQRIPPRWSTGLRVAFERPNATVRIPFQEAGVGCAASGCTRQALRTVSSVCSLRCTRYAFVQALEHSLARSLRPHKRGPKPKTTHN